MPSVRFSRDKRGYEYIYLVHTPTRRGRPGRPRVLYWYRTPPGVRIGRKPFDEEVQRTLEQQNPGLTFDWEAIIGTPMPPPDMTELWRERRRAEKAARQERRAAEAADAGQPEREAEPESAGPESPRADSQSATDSVVVDLHDQMSRAQSDLDEVEPSGVAALTVASTSAPEPATGPSDGGTSDESGPPRKRRRRRGGRRRRGAANRPAGEPQAGADADDAVDLSAVEGEDSDADEIVQSDRDDPSSEEE